MWVHTAEDADAPSLPLPELVVVGRPTGALCQSVANNRRVRCSLVSAHKLRVWTTR